MNWLRYWFEDSTCYPPEEVETTFEGDVGALSDDVKAAFKQQVRIEMAAASKHLTVENITNVMPWALWFQART